MVMPGAIQTENQFVFFDIAIDVAIDIAFDNAVDGDLGDPNSFGVIG